jgi:FlaG/FlaF family flagellin (archaellin)
MCVLNPQPGVKTLSISRNGDFRPSHSTESVCPMRDTIPVRRTFSSRVATQTHRPSVQVRYRSHFGATDVPTRLPTDDTPNGSTADVCHGPGHDAGDERDARLSDDSRDASSRAITPVAEVLLLALTVGLAAATAGAVLELGDVDDRSPQASLSLVVDDRMLAISHRGGDELDVRDLRVVVAVDGEPLVHQPPVPFFSAEGYRPGPTGPFNSATDPRWTAGETATLRVAGTNQPALAAGNVATVRLFVDGRPVAELRATVD